MSKTKLSDGSELSIRESEKEQMADDLRAEVRMVKYEIKTLLEQAQRAYDVLVSKIDYMLDELTEKIQPNPNVIVGGDFILPCFIPGLFTSKASCDRALKRHGIDPEMIENMRDVIYVAQFNPGTIKIDFYPSALAIYKQYMNQSCTSSAYASEEPHGSTPQPFPYDDIPYSTLKMALEWFRANNTPNKECVVSG